MFEGIYCPDCAGDNVIPDVRLGGKWYKCLDCGCRFYDPIILDAIAPTDDAI